MSRTVPTISFRDYENRREEIGRQLIDAAEHVGFFAICDQEFPTKEDIERQFSFADAFFQQPDEMKGKTPLIKEKNTGWEKQAQIRPSSGTPDQKESLQLQQHLKEVNWPNIIPGFKEHTDDFMTKTRILSMRILSFFAEELGFESDFFDKAHDVTSSDAQSTLRMLHYHDITGTQLPPNYWRAGAHCDFDVLTLLYQRDGESGLEVCPGREAHTSFAMGDVWTPVPAKTGNVVCNIGDMLMSWSDDRFKSNFHRVRAPGLNEYQGKRLSLAYFNQANKDVVIQGPLKKYAPLTGAEYILEAMRRNFAQYKPKAVPRAQSTALPSNTAIAGLA